LLTHKGEQEELIQSVGQDWTNLDLVFPSGVGTPLTASNIRRDFRQLLAASRLPKIRFHDLPHTAASLMLNHGIPVLIVSKRLGHSKPSITLDVYGHLIPSRQEEAAQLMDNLMLEV
jgi:integrase